MKNNILIIVFFSFVAYNSYAQEPTDTVKVEDIDIGDIDLDEIEIDDIELEDVDDDVLGQGSTFPWEKFSVGGQIGSPSFGSDFTSVNLAPEIVYHLNDKVSFGVDGIFERTRIKRIFDRQTYQYVKTDYKQNNTGGRLFSRLQPLESLPVFLQLEYEGENVTNPYRRDGTKFPSVKQDLHNFNAGLGFNNGPYFIGLMYNFMNQKNKDEFNDLAQKDSNTDVDYSRNYPTNAIAFRTGINIRLGQGGGKNKKKKKKSRNKKRRVED